MPLDPMKSKSRSIPIGRRDANFDRACDDALRCARAQYRGYLKSTRHNKETDFLMVEFEGYHYDGSRHEDPHQY